MPAMRVNRPLALSSVALAGCVGALDTHDLAAGVSIDEVAAYQAVERVLYGEGEDADVPLVEQKPTLLRVFVSTDDAYDGGPVTAVFTVGDEVFEVDVPALAPVSDRADLDSTINLEVPPELVGATLDWSVELLQADGAGDNPSASVSQSEVVDAAANVLRMVLVPYRYDADGSGREPDTSPERIEELRSRILATYPVSDVQIDLHDPVSIGTEVGPEYGSWLGMTLRIAALRAEEAPDDDVYYYGLVNPADTNAAFCAGADGCIGGIAPLNTDGPEGVGTPAMRVGAGLGFPQSVADIAIHELGHAHGRAHAPCTGNAAPDDTDPDYPRDDGRIEVWGWDASTGALREPGVASDFMGYCADKHVSAYTWRALHERSVINPLL